MNKRTEQTLKKELNKREISNLPDTEFKILVIRMLLNLGKEQMK